MAAGKQNQFVAGKLLLLEKVIDKLIRLVIPVCSHTIIVICVLHLLKEQISLIQCGEFLTSVCALT